MTRGVDPPEVEGYQWDGWKLIMIAKLNTDGTFHSRKWSCVWRPDVGSGLYARSDWMRAGGVGGVAWMQTGAVQSYSYGTGSAEVHVPLADHMGNVRHYYQFKSTKGNVTGQLVASYEYDAFGREVRAWGLNTPTENQPPGLPASRPWADLLPFHYSSKLRDVDSGFNYYGYRFYDPGAGRWLNRDPLDDAEIIEGPNLYRAFRNSGTYWVDTDGRGTTGMTWGAIYGGAFGGVYGGLLGAGGGTVVAIGPGTVGGAIGGATVGAGLGAAGGAVIGNAIEEGLRWAFDSAKNAMDSIRNYGDDLEEDDDSLTNRPKPMKYAPRPIPGGIPRDREAQNTQAKDAVAKAKKKCEEAGGKWNPNNTHQTVQEARTGDFDKLVEALLDAHCSVAAEKCPIK